MKAPRWRPRSMKEVDMLLQEEGFQSVENSPEYKARAEEIVEWCRTHSGEPEEYACECESSPVELGEDGQVVIGEYCLACGLPFEDVFGDRRM